jgi:hypothetical protein
MNFKFYTLLLLVLAIILPSTADAHEPDHSYLYMRIYGEAIGGRVEVTGEDINQAFGLSINEELSQEELQIYLPRLQEYVKSKVRFSSGDTQYEIKFTEPEILPLDETIDFLRLHFDLVGVDKMPEKLDIEYNVFLDESETQRGVLIIEYNWKAGIVNNQALITNVFGGDKRTETLVLAEKGLWKGFVALVKLGIWHIWIGLDHILFIIALILPAVVRRRKEDDYAGVADDSYSKEWAPVDQFRPAFFYILKIITFFTIAHSITLALAALEIITLPSQIVETIIALSIALAALHNITPIFKAKEWIIAFVFGLFHGFGFASVLGEKGLSGDFMILSLLGFNVGVEIGQVLIICLAFPILFLLRPYKIYPKILFFGSILLIIISLYWGIERGFDTDLPAGAYFWKFYNSIFG